MNLTLGPSPGRPGKPEVLLAARMVYAAAAFLVSIQVSVRPS